MSTLSLQRGEKPVEVVKKPHKSTLTLEREAREAAAAKKATKKTTTTKK